MDIITHQLIDKELCGTPVMVETEKPCGIYDHAQDGRGWLRSGAWRIYLRACRLCCHACCQSPQCCAWRGRCKILKPVKAGESVYAQAGVTEISGKKQMVDVTVKREDEVVFKGEFSCFVLEKHVLE